MPTCTMSIAGRWASSPAIAAGERYKALAERISETLDFMEACGITPDSVPQLRQTEFYTSHEALLLGYEQALTRIDSTSGDWYDTSAHMLWIGDRTRQLDGAHVEFCRGIKNPIGLKCGPGLEADDLLRLIDAAQPGQRGRPPDADRPFRRRQGGRQAAAPDPRRASARAPRWCGPPIPCTATPSSRQSGYKTRPFDRILEEVQHLLRRAPGRGHPCRRRAFRNDRPERHRMPRRRPGDSPRPICPAAITPIATRGSMPARRWSWPS